MRLRYLPLLLLSLLVGGLAGAAAPAMLRAMSEGVATTNIYVDGGLPTPGVTPGPTWATQLNNYLLAVDAHDHTSGKGVQVPESGLNINADLPINGHGLTSVGRINLSAQASPVALDLYTDGTDLYFKDANGNAVKVTASGGINVGTTRGINGQYSTDAAHPSAFYTTVSGRYTLTTNGSTRAALAFGALFMGATSVSADTTIADTDGTALLNVSSVGGARTITLPVASSNTGRVIIIKDSAGSANSNAITVVRQLTDTIDGATSKTINSAYGVLRLESGGAGVGWLTF